MIYHGYGIGGGLIGFVAMYETLSRSYEIDVLSIFESSAVDYMKNYGINAETINSFFYNKIYGLMICSAADYFALASYLRFIKNTFANILSMLYFARRILKNLKKEYNAVYLNSLFIPDWAVAAKMSGFKVIMHVREPLSSNKYYCLCSKIIKFIIRKYCDSIITISYDNLYRLDLNGKCAEVVYDKVIERREIATCFNPNPHYKYFTYTGGDARIKGFETIVKSLSHLDHNIKIIFAGHYERKKNPTYKRLLQAIVNPFQIKKDYLIRLLYKSDNAIVIGVTDGIYDYYKNSMATICPFSVPHAPLPVIESYALGKPVITSDIVGMDEFNPSTTGWQFKNNDHIDLAQKINTVARMPANDYKEYCERVSEQYSRYIFNESKIMTIFERSM